MQPDDGQSCRGQRFQTGQECRFYGSYQSDPLKKQRKRTDSPKQDDHRHIEDRPSVQACRDLPALGDQGQGEPPMNIPIPDTGILPRCFTGALESRE